jgi:C4-dicarboxylate transporter DctM subunit
VFSTNFAESPFVMAIPMLTFAGYVLAESGAPGRLIDLSRAWLGWLPGSLAVVCLVASSFFATITGGSAATIIAVGGLLYPVLTKEKYPDSFAVGLITTAGALGALFPPSMLLIFYCIVARLPVEKALLAGVMAGVLTTVALGAYCAYVGIKAGVPRHPFVLAAGLREMWRSKWELAIPFVLLAPISTGWLKFQEATAFIVVYVVVIEMFVYRDLRTSLARIAVESMMLFGAVMAILTTAVSFNGWLIQAEVPTYLFDLFDAHVKSQVTFLLALNLFLLVVGMVTDGMTAIIVVAPLVLPLAEPYGIDPFHLAVVFLLNLEISFLVPPVGMNLFVSSLRFGKSLTFVCRSVVPFLILLTVTLLIVSYVPWLSTYFPSLVGNDDWDLLRSLPGDPLKTLHD